MEVPISVEEALRRVLENSHPLDVVSYRLDDDRLLGSVLAESVFASGNIPLLPTSIMDGFAVSAPLAAGVYEVAGSVLAGDDPEAAGQGAGKVCYITTGGQLPSGTNAVVKIEDTEYVDGSEEREVRIRVSAAAGQHVRQIGSDIAAGELVLAAGTPVGPAELGLLATIGCCSVRCYRRPVVGVLSTGNELVDPWAPCGPNQIRDSNRIALLAAFKEERLEVRDLGIVRDSAAQLREVLLGCAGSGCDIVCTSGGVSMGKADYVKPLLRELGAVHFSKLDMKPGKPTTFATLSTPSPSSTPSSPLSDAIDSTSSTTVRREVLFFGLPGNPVSCLVGAALFVVPAVRRMQGLPLALCRHPTVPLQLGGPAESLALDMERPEYHRAVLSSSATGLTAVSTGPQRSSRLLSMRSANALLLLPQGAPGREEVRKGVQLTALLLRHLATLPDTPTPAPPQGCSSTGVEEVPGDWTSIRVGLLTVSDRASSGVYEDLSGPAMARLLDEMASSRTPEGVAYPLTFTVTQRAVVPDSVPAIQQVVTAWCEPGSGTQVDVLLTSGGTGFGSRDYTPEALKGVLHREAPGIAQALLAEGLRHTPLALLSRPVAGTRHSTFIASLPGSVKAVKENMAALRPLLPRVCELLKTDDCNPRFNK